MRNRHTKARRQHPASASSIAAVRMFSLEQKQITRLKRETASKYLLFLSPARYDMAADEPLVRRSALAYPRNPFCSSAACSQDGKNIQIHPGGSHSPAHSHRCSRCIHLYLQPQNRQGPSVCVCVCALVLRLSCCVLHAVLPPQWASPYMV